MISSNFKYMRAVGTFTSRSEAEKARLGTEKFWFLYG